MELAARNGATAMQAISAQNAKIAALEEQIRVLTNHVMTLQAKMDAMHSIQAKALQAKYRGGTDELGG